MSKLVTSDNLKAYHSELAEHLQLLERDKAYSVGDTVKYDGLTLKCTIAGNTDVNKVDYSSIDIGDTIVDGTVTFTVIDPNSMWYEEDKFYMVDDIVVYNDKFYKCITAHTATATFDTTKWSEISAGGGGSSGGGISVWQANTNYAVNDVVIDSNLIWQCATAHTSSTTFDESKWICLSGGEISNGLEIVPLWEGSFSFSNSTNTPTSSTPMIELSDSIQNYEYFYVEAVDSALNNICSSIIRLKNFNNCYRVGFFAVGGYFLSTTINFYDSYNVYLNNAAVAGYQLNTCYITSVQGIRKAKPIVSSGMKYETLWEGEAGNYSGSTDTTINLSNSVNKYRKLGLTLVALSSSNERIMYYEVNTSDYANLITSGGSGDKLAYGWPGNTSAWFEINSNSTQNQLSIHCGLMKITKVVGISEGVQIPTGVQAARVTLWEGKNNSYITSTNYADYANVQQQLNDSIRNYDYLEVYLECDNNIVGTFNDTSRAICTLSVKDLAPNTNTYRINAGIMSSSNGISYIIVFPDDTHYALGHANIASWARNPGVIKIVGIKYIQPDSYSTEEKLIGTWIDGKPLYRKTIQMDNLSIQSYQRYDINTTSLLDNDNISIVNMFGGYLVDYGTSTQQYHPWGQEFSSSSNQFSYAMYYRQAERVLSIIGSWGGGSKIIDKAYVSIEYTKN